MAVESELDDVAFGARGSYNVGGDGCEGERSRSWPPYIVPRRWEACCLQRSRSAGGGGSLILSVSRRGDDGVVLFQRGEREATQLIISKDRREGRAQWRWQLRRWWWSP
jgi:hypothetical protein